ncbi:hypothetical protein SGLAM104S_00973 [Streptomyces glaucescens]
MTATHPTPALFALSDVRGPVLRPGDDGYAEEVTGFNLAALHTPDVVVVATGADDVVAAMRWAGATGTPVAVQATGHGANFPIDHGLLISTARMTDVRADPAGRTATVAAGAKWSHVMAAGAPHGLAVSAAPPRTRAWSATRWAADCRCSAGPTASPPALCTPSRSSPRTAPCATRTPIRSRSCSGHCAAARATSASSRPS